MNNHHVLLFFVLLLQFIGSSSSRKVTATDDNDNNNNNNNDNNNNDDVSSLIISDINVLIVTDVHSWIGGHSNKKQSNGQIINIDYGDVISFYEHFKYYCNQQQKDLYLVMNGDFMDGTGLATNGDASRLIPLLEKMPYDLLTVGNHELYDNSIIQQMIQPSGFIEWWGNKYISSNVVHATNKSTTSTTSTTTQSQSQSSQSQSIGHKYAILKGKYSGNVLVFGFLYNMMDADTLVHVETVEEIVNDPNGWFQHVLLQPTEEYSSILILAHMGTQNTLLDVIVNAIRATINEPTTTTMPIQLITGHTHVRDYRTLDAASTAIESGRFLDTIGFVSFPNQTTYNATLVQQQQQQLEQQQQQQEQQQQQQQQIIQQEQDQQPPEQEQQEQQQQQQQQQQQSLTGTNDTTQSTTTPNYTTTSTATTNANIVNDTNNNGGGRQLTHNNGISHTTSTSTSTTISTATTATNTSTNNSTLIDHTDDPIIKSLFHHTFIDGNLNVLIDTLFYTGMIDIDTNTFKTIRGQEMTDFIYKVRTELGLTKVIGCIPENSDWDYNLKQHSKNNIGPPPYRIDREIHEKDSLWKLFHDDVIPSMFGTNYPNMVLFLDSGNWRYDLLSNNVTVDDIYAVSPYNDTLIGWDDIPGSIIVQLNKTLNLNSGGFFIDAHTTINIPNYIMTPAILPFDTKTMGSKNYTFVCGSFHAKKLEPILYNLLLNYSTQYHYDDNNLPIHYNLGISTTNIWIQYIQQRFPAPCKSFTDNIKSSIANLGNTIGNTFRHHDNNDNGVDSQQTFQSNNEVEEEDRIFLFFTVTAVSIVLIMSIIVVREKGRYFHLQTSANENESLNAINNYTNESRQYYNPRNNQNNNDDTDNDELEFSEQYNHDNNNYENYKSSRYVSNNRMDGIYKNDFHDHHDNRHHHRPNIEQESSIDFLDDIHDADGINELI